MIYFIIIEDNEPRVGSAKSLESYLDDQVDEYGSEEHYETGESYRDYLEDNMVIISKEDYNRGKELENLIKEDESCLDDWHEFLAEFL